MNYLARAHSSAESVQGLGWYAVCNSQWVPLSCPGLLRPHGVPQLPVNNLAFRMISLSLTGGNEHNHADQSNQFACSKVSHCVL